MEEKRKARKAAQENYGQGKKKKKAINVLKRMKFNNHAKEEKKANDAKRAKRETEMSAVHKRARKVREESKTVQRRAKVEKSTERGGGDEPAVE